MTRLTLVVIIGAITGCTVMSPPSPLPSPLPPPPPRASTVLLAQADRLVTDGRYADAVDVYGQIVAKYPGTEDAGRASSRRDTVAGLLAARAQLARLMAEMKAQEAELMRTREQVAARDGELAKARQEIARLNAETARLTSETARLTSETDRLRADLENLKKIDIDLERRRK